MSVSFCPACGTPKIAPNARFCHVCGASLSPEDIQARAGSDPMYATPPSAPQTPLYGTPPLGNAVPYTAAPPPAYTIAPGGAIPIYDVPMYATPFAAAMPAPAVSPGRATGITFAAIGAALGFGIATTIILDFLPFLAFFRDFYYYSIRSFDFTAIAFFSVISSFWYGSLRLALSPATRTWLEAWGIGFVTLAIVAFITTYISLSNENTRLMQEGYDYFNYRSEFFHAISVGVPVSAIITGLGSLIGVSIASGFARWRIFRPLTLGLSFAQMVELAFGIPCLLFVLVELPAILLLAYRYGVLYLPVFLVVAIGVLFIVRGMVLRRLRAARPDLFVAPPATGNSVF